MSWLADVGLDLWSLLGLAGSAALGFFGKLLGGWKGYLVAFLAGGALTLFATLKVVGWQDAAEERDRLRWQLEGERVTAAANEAAHAIELADKAKALAAVEAAAAAAAERNAELAAQIEAIRALPDVENCPLGLETMKLLEGLL